jgi:hypothetical protein
MMLMAHELGILPIARYGSEELKSLPAEMRVGRVDASVRALGSGRRLQRERDAHHSCQARR